MKSYLHHDYGIEEDFLGLIDAACFLGRFLGIIYHLLYPPSNPKTRYLISSVFISLTLGFVPFASEMSDYIGPLLLLIFFVTGFGRAAVVFPIFLVNQYFDARNRKDQFIVGIWLTSAGIGDLIGLSTVYSCIHYIGWSWKISFVAYVGIFLLCSIFMFITLDSFDNTNEVTGL